ncbi:SusD/RagB family nutrient-binding outer membrane lipoprotein [Chitinophaga horti]|uniref:SusD/RagB family nutrient-binding outer membrane lipoprotein n=1 Tax=Chitinophaga horti TaxID=2920382 RepID=A0ABY6J5U0_9BACT|nr:SusD/RagB family nutrient-binding outer membrane lipoprotein [Chitinophaga horti]UYQ93659.1 SusD/RagB family nutrient-binding outer membrane lipoprotein [Chitinophaga horti]
MKQLTYKLSAAFVLAVLLLTGCTKDFKKLNTSPNNTTDVLPGQLLAPALVNTLTYNLSRNRNFNNELMQVTVDMNDGEGRVFRYDFNNTWADYLYNNWYIQLTNLKDMYRLAADTTSPEYNKTYMGISLICQSWIYSLLTDAYGDVPFRRSNLGRDSLIYEPQFDQQKDIYAGIFDNLERANVLLSTSQAIDPAFDPVYNGAVLNWRKFGNSLYLRLLLRISGKQEVAQQAIAKFQEIAGDPLDYPIITTTAESAILKWTGKAPFQNPLTTAVREQDYRAPGIASFFIDHLVAWNDPRINISLGANGINRWGIAQSTEGFKGVPSGYLPGQGGAKKSYFLSNTSTTSMQTDPLAGMILNVAEVKLMLAEATVKGWLTATPAATYYNDGARLSIQQWMPTWNVDIVTHLTNADMQWNDAETLEEKMEKIHLQKYYALFMTDLQQWFEYRRTGHPNLPKGPGLANNGVMPARFNYPVYVQSANPTNYKLAIAAQGPDDISTQVWWQKP